MLCWWLWISLPVLSIRGSILVFWCWWTEISHHKNNFNILLLWYMGWFGLENKTLLWYMGWSSLENLFFWLLLTLDLKFYWHFWYLNIEDIIYKVKINVWHSKYLFDFTFSHNFIYFNAWNFDLLLDRGIVPCLFFSKNWNDLWIDDFHWFGCVLLTT